MIPTRQVRFALIVALLLSLILYHATNIYFPRPNSEDLFTIFKVVQVAITSTLFGIAVYSSWIAKLLLWGNYIGGCYKGRSSDYVPRQTPRLAARHEELFTITQNLFDTRISGRSFISHEGELTLISTWSGRLIEADGDTYVFGIELSNDVSEFGTIKATFDGTGAQGFYYSGAPKTKYSSRFEGERIRSREYQAALKSLYRATTTAVIPRLSLGEVVQEESHTAEPALSQTGASLASQGSGGGSWPEI